MKKDILAARYRCVQSVPHDHGSHSFDDQDQKNGGTYKKKKGGKKIKDKSF